MGIGCCMLFSCISNKKIVYLKDQTQPAAHDYLNDTSFVQQAVDYRLEPHDIVYVKINRVELTQNFQQTSVDLDPEARAMQSRPYLLGYTVDAEGKVDLPTLGKVEVAGLTILEAQAKILETARQFYDSPSVKVYLLNFYVTILGEVNTPGRYPVFNNRITVMEALGFANDATDFANRSEVRVLRSRDGVNEIYPIDLTDQQIMGKEAFYLLPNDVVLVKPQKRKKYAGRDLQNVFNAISAAVSIATLYLLIIRE